MTEDATIRTKKNLLKVNGTAWALAAAHTLYNVQEGVQKDDVSYATVAVQATMAAICFWKGFEE